VQAPDFGFRFENLSCYNDILDTFEGTFTDGRGLSCACTCDRALAPDR